MGRRPQRQKPLKEDGSLDDPSKKTTRGNGKHVFLRKLEGDKKVQSFRFKVEYLLGIVQRELRVHNTYAMSLELLTKFEQCSRGF